MRNPCLVVANGQPLILACPTEEKAIEAGKSWQAENGDDLRWNVVDLECVTVIWGDDEHTGPGVFNFSFVEMGEHSFSDKEFQPIDQARTEFYYEKISLDPEYFDEVADDGVTTTTMGLDDYLNTIYTLIAILPGRISELG